jgi:nitrous oxidase accessory protein
MRKSITLLLVLVLLIASCETMRSTADADSKSIIVPEDYSTIAAAVGNATDGDTILVRKGTYEGPINQTLMINKTLSLIGEDDKQTRLNLHPAQGTTIILDKIFSGYANPIKIEADNVRISGFTITSDGGTISVTGNRTQITGNILNTHLQLIGSHQTLAGNTIAATINCDGSYGNIYANNVIKATIAIGGFHNSVYANNVTGLQEYYVNGIGTGTGGDYNLIYHNIVEDGGGIGANSVGNIIANNIITNGAVGIGITLGDNNIIFGNTITNNRGPGITKKEGLNNIFYANYVVNNSVGVLFGTKTLFLSGQNTLYRNNFINNIQQTQIVNLDHSDNWDNDKEGNYWSDYRGIDLDGNGIGDTPYVMFGDSYHENYPYVTYGDSYEDRYPLIAPFDIESVQTQLPEWAANVSNVNPEVPRWSLQEPEPEPQPESFPTTLVIASVIVVAVVAVVLLVYFKKRKH